MSERSRQIAVVFTDITKRKNEEKRQAFLLKLSDLLRPLSDPVAVAKITCRTLVGHLNASRAQFTEVEGETGAEMGVVRGEYIRSGQPMAHQYPLSAFGETLVAVLRAGETLVLTDTESDPRLSGEQRKTFSAVESPAAVSIPLVKNNRLTATFTVHNTEPRDWKAGEVALIEEVADRTWAAFEQARAEEARQKSERNYHELVQSSPSLIAAFEGKSHIIGVVNEATLKTWRKGKEIIGKPFAETMPGLKEQGIADSLDKVFETGEVVTAYETPVHFLQGGNEEETGYFNLIFYPQRDAHGTITGVVKIASEVTQEAKFNQKIKESEARYRQMADLMPAKIINFSPKGDAYYYNRQYLDFFGVPMEQLEGWGWQKFVHPEDLPEMHKKWKNALARGIEFEMEFRLKDKSGKYKWHLSRTIPIKNQSGEIQLWIAATTEIQKFKDEEKRKEDFLKMVSHELKTPVTSIKGYIQLLLGMLKKEKEAQLSTLPVESSLERMDMQITRLTRLISDILDVSRLEKGKIELQKTTFNIGELVKEAVQDINYTNSGHEIKIHEKYDCEIFADKDRIGQVLINLVTNAIKYSPENKTIDISIEKPGKNKLKVSIKDRGIGISEKDLNKVFKRFYRAEGKNQDTFAGFGIGLFLCKEIIERHGGSIYAKSTKGKGSTFGFVLECKAP